MNRWTLSDDDYASVLADTKSYASDELYAKALIAQRKWLLTDNEWYARASEVLGRFLLNNKYGLIRPALNKRSSFLAVLMNSIKDKMEQLELAGLEDVIDYILDEEQLAKDPYKYYGVSRRDFI